MTKGSNASLSALSENVSSAIISLGWSSPTGEGDADVSVLLLDAGGKVRSDADFYFYNNPVAADGSVQLLGKEPTGDGSEDRISFDLTAVPADVERIVVAASRYEGARFGELDDLKVTLADAVGESLLRFVIEDAGEVSAIIGDPRALEVVESWERLIRQVCLRLGGELGQKVLPAQRTRRGTDPGARRARLADQLCLEGRLQAELRVDGAPGLLTLSADLRTAKLRTSVEIPAPEQGYPLTWAKRLVRRLAEAPADLHVETLVEGGTGGPRGTLERLRPEPADLLPKDNATRITGFRLSLFKGMGSGRGSAESGFIRSVDDAVQRFHSSVVVHLDAPASGRTAAKERAAV
ncbi:TerD family protein [Streptomyces violaceus]|uniref:TerD family protein n=1 Tax=Streptomyces violaceus TaxID=1936 RepID=UPI003808607C